MSDESHVKESRVKSTFGCLLILLLILAGGYLEIAGIAYAFYRYGPGYGIAALLFPPYALYVGAKETFYPSVPLAVDDTRVTLLPPVSPRGPSASNPVLFDRADAAAGSLASTMVLAGDGSLVSRKSVAEALVALKPVFAPTSMEYRMKLRSDLNEYLAAWEFLFIDGMESAMGGLDWGPEREGVSERLAAIGQLRNGGLSKAVESLKGHIVESNRKMRAILEAEGPLTDDQVQYMRDKLMERIAVGRVEAERVLGELIPIHR